MDDYGITLHLQVPPQKVFGPLLRVIVTVGVFHRLLRQNESTECPCFLMTDLVGLACRWPNGSHTRM